MLKVSDLFDYLEKKVPQMSIENVLDRESLDLFQWAVELEDTKELLLGSDGRYLKSLVTYARPNPINPTYIFNDPKYSHLSTSSPTQSPSSMDSSSSMMLRAPKIV